MVPFLRVAGKYSLGKITHLAWGIFLEIPLLTAFVGCFFLWTNHTLDEDTCPFSQFDSTEWKKNHALFFWEFILSFTMNIFKLLKTSPKCMLYVPKISSPSGNLFYPHSSTTGLQFCKLMASLNVLGIFLKRTPPICTKKFLKTRPCTKTFFFAKFIVFFMWFNTGNWQSVKLCKVRKWREKRYGRKVG